MAIGDEQGSKRRQEELKRLREESVKATESINFLNESIKTTQKQLKEVGGMDFMKAANVGMDSLTKRMSQVTVETLKSSKARKAFGQDLIKAQEQQAQNEAAITNIQRERELLTLDIAKREKEVVQIRKQGAAAYEAEMDKVKGIVLQAKDEEIQAEQALIEARKTGKANLVAEAEAALSSARLNVRAQENVESKTRQIAEEKRANFEKSAKERQEEIDDLSRTNALYGVQSDQINERNQELENSINKGKQLEQTMKEIDSAPGAFIKGFEDFSKLVGQVPILGSVFEAIAGDISKSAQMFRDAKAEGKGFFNALSTAAAGFIKLGAFAAISAFISQVVEGAMKSSEALKTVTQGLGGGMIDASAAMKSASGAASAMGIPLQEAAGYIGQMNDSLGTSLGFSAKQVTTFGTLTRNMGVSGEAAAKLFKFAVKTGTSYEDMAANVAGTTEKLNAMNGTAVAPKAVFEEMGSASQTILRNMKDNPDALIKAAAGARAMGLEMNRIADAAESTLDFESSMAKEMEAELMLGKELNLDKLRAAAATGDQVTMQEEMKRLVMENKDALEGNVLAQGMFADTLGISKEELNKMLNTTEDQAKMAEQDAARKKANAENEKKTARELGEQQLTLFKRVNSLADRIAKFQESLALGAKNFFDAFMDGIKPLRDLFKKAFDTGDWMEGIKVFAKGIIPALKSSLGNVGKLVKDSLLNGFSGLGDAISKEGDSIFSKGGILGKMLGGLALGGGALTIALKGVKGLKNAFGFLTGKKKGMDNVEVVRGAAKVVIAGGGPTDLLGNKGRAGLFKQFKTLFKKPKVFFRALKMKGGMLGKIVGNIGSRLSNIKLPNLSKLFSKIPLPNLKGLFSKIPIPSLKGLFSRIKLPNLTKMFSKIKLPNLTNLFKNLKLPKLPGMSKIGGVLSKLNPLKLLKGKGGAKAAGAAANVASKAAVKTGAKIAAKIGANALKAIPVVGQVAMIGMAAYDAFQGVKKTGEFFGKNQEDTTTGEKVSAGIGSALSGLTFGLLDAGKAARGIKAAGDFVADKAKAGWEGIKKGAAAFGGWVSSGWDSLKQGFSNVKDKATEIANTVKEKVGDFANAVKDKAVAAKDAIVDFAGGVKDKAVAFASSVGEGISNFASAAGEKISNFGATVGAGIMSFASSARDKAAAFAGAVGEKIGNIRGKIGEFLEANDGLVGGIKAAASGIASKAKEMLGSAWKGIKNFVTGGDSDKSKKAAPEIKEAEIKKVTTPLVQMSSSQSKELVTAINASMAKGAESTVQAVNAFGDHLEPFITDSKESANAQLQELKQLTREQNEQYKKQMIELQNQTAALFQIATKKDNIIKMDSFRVGKAITSRY